MIYNRYRTKKGEAIKSMIKATVKAPIINRNILQIASIIIAIINNRIQPVLKLNSLILFNIL